MIVFSKPLFEHQFERFQGSTPEEIAKVIIATYLRKGLVRQSIYWLYLRELSLSFIKEIIQLSLDDALGDKSIPRERRDFLNKINGPDSILFQWDLLDPYPDEMIESMISEHEDQISGARDFILSARGF